MDKPVLSRRSFVVGGASTACIAVTGCNGFWMLIRVSPVATAVGAITTSIVANLLTPSVQNFGSQIVDFSTESGQRLREAYEEAGYGRAVATRGAEVIGPEKMARHLKDKSPIWVQGGAANRNFNLLEIEYKNTTSREVSGQIQYGIRDIATGRIEDDPWDDPFALGRYEKETKIFPFRHSFPRPGLKRLELLTAPKGIGWKSKEILVLPLKYT